MQQENTEKHRASIYIGRISLEKGAGLAFYADQELDPWLRYYRKDEPIEVMQLVIDTSPEIFRIAHGVKPSREQIDETGYSFARTMYENNVEYLEIFNGGLLIYPEKLEYLRSYEFPLTDINHHYALSSLFPMRHYLAKINGKPGILANDTENARALELAIDHHKYKEKGMLPEYYTYGDYPALDRIMSVIEPG